MQDESVWLTQQHMAELFQTTQQNISQHILNIDEEGELEPGQRTTNSCQFTRKVVDGFKGVWISTIWT